MKERKHVGTVTKDDCTWQFFRAGGSGGQSQNKSDSGCRCIHKESGAVGESREHKSQLQNRRAAFKRMAGTKEFKLWVRKQAGIDAKLPDPEEVVARQMHPSNLLVEVREDGKWVTQ